MTATKIETLYTLTRKIRRTKKKIQRKVKEFLGWCLVGFVVAGFILGMFYIWLEFGYIL